MNALFLTWSRSDYAAFNVFCTAGKCAFLVILCLPGSFSFISFAYGFNINKRSDVSREQ